MIKNMSLANITRMLKVVDVGYRSLLDLTGPNSTYIAKVPYSREKLRELKHATENLLKEFQPPLSSEELEEQNHAIMLLNAINSAIYSRL